MIRRTDKRLRLCIAALTLNLAFIWINSMLPGEVSGAFSQWVKDLLASLSGGEPGPEGHGLLRKLAHFTEFALLGVCFVWLWGMLRSKPLLVASLSLGCGFLAACMDETIQIFTPDRHASFTDVLIDTAGITAGAALLTLVICCKQQNKNIIFGGKQT